MIGARRHHVSWFQRMYGTHPLDDSGNLVSHIAGVVVLLQVFVDPKLDRQVERIIDFVSRHQPGPHGGERVSGLHLIKGVSRWKQTSSGTINESHPALAASPLGNRLDLHHHPIAVHLATTPRDRQLDAAFRGRPGVLGNEFLSFQNRQRRIKLRLGVIHSFDLPQQAKEAEHGRPRPSWRSVIVNLRSLPGGDSRIVGIGETGLDFYYNHSDKKIQKKSFVEHISAASQLNIPVIVHSRNAETDTYEIIKSEKKNSNLKVLMHCFTGSKDFAKKLIDIDCYFSVSGILSLIHI